eukprot:7247137-Prymnesium_polylepis.3
MRGDAKEKPADARAAASHGGRGVKVTPRSTIWAAPAVWKSVPLHCCSAKVVNVATKIGPSPVVPAGTNKLVPTDVNDVLCSTVADLR